VEGQGKVAVAFSGGLDSSVIAKSAANHTDVVACTAYAGHSGDLTRAREAAEALELPLVTCELTVDDARATLSALRLPFTPSLMDRSLWCLYAVVSRTARTCGAKVMLLGQLADELFGGYAKYDEALKLRGGEAAESMMGTDLREYASRGRVRDVAACGGLVEPRFPFEAKELGEFATSLPITFKIRDGERKAVLRRAALVLGVPEKVAYAPKKAAQYSSGVQKLVSSSGF
jgi:asparagine synthase (glutamine-hydrolysing)